MRTQNSLKYFISLFLAKYEVFIIRRQWTAAAASVQTKQFVYVNKAIEFGAQHKPRTSKFETLRADETTTKKCTRIDIGCFLFVHSIEMVALNFAKSAQTRILSYKIHNKIVSYKLIYQFC